MVRWSTAYPGSRMSSPAWPASSACALSTARNANACVVCTLARSWPGSAYPYGKCHASRRRFHQLKAVEAHRLPLFPGVLASGHQRGGVNDRVDPAAQLRQTTRVGQVRTNQLARCSRRRRQILLTAGPRRQPQLGPGLLNQCPDEMAADEARSARDQH